MALKIALLTSCSVTRNFTPIVKIQDTPVFGTMTELCQWWVDAMRGAATNKGNLRTPGELYAGIAFTAVTEIAQEIGHDNIFIVTGGTGMSRHTDKIVPYDFTMSKSEEFNAHQHVTGEKFLPHVWWEKINGHLHKSNTPVTDLLKKYDIIVSALPKAFIKYLTSDLMHIPEEDLQTRVFLPIPRSMIGSFPKLLHSAFVPYDGGFTADLTCSRYDKAQKVAQKFISHCTSIEDAGMYAQVIKDQSTAAITQTGNGHTSMIDYDTLFENFPILIETGNVGIAIRQAKALGLPIGSKQQFAGAWRGARGTIEVEEKVPHKAMAAIKTMLLTPAKNSPFKDDEILGQIGLFVQALRDEQPEFIFVPANVAAWGKIVYGEGEPIAKAAKITHILNYHTKYLGLELIMAGTSKGYRILQ